MPPGALDDRACGRSGYVDRKRTRIDRELRPIWNLNRQVYAALLRDVATLDDDGILHAHQPKVVVVEGCVERSLLFSDDSNVRIVPAFYFH
jgi:hypothetical protein